MYFFNAALKLHEWSQNRPDGQYEKRKVLKTVGSLDAVLLVPEINLRDSST